MTKFNVGDRVVAVGEETRYGMADDMWDLLYNAEGMTVRRVNEQVVIAGGWTWSPENLRLADEQPTPVAEKPKTLSTTDLIKEAKKVLMGSPERRGSQNGVAIHLKEGAPPRVSTGPCHGFIRLAGNTSSLAIITLLVRHPSSGYGRGQCKKEVLEAYYGWLLARSPWSNCFYGRSGKVAVREGCTALRTNVPANMLQGALISTRNTWEFPSAINLWYKLVQKGVEENAAFVACHFVSFDGEQVRVCPVQRDHIAISTSSMTKEGLTAFLEGKPLYTTSPYNQRGTHNGVHRAFTGRGDELYSLFRSEFNSYGQVSSVIRNPFVKAKPVQSREKSMSVDKYASFVKDVFPKFVI